MSKTPDGPFKESLIPLNPVRLGLHSIGGDALSTLHAGKTFWSSVGTTAKTKPTTRQSTKSLSHKYVRVTLDAYAGRWAKMHKDRCLDSETSIARDFKALPQDGLRSTIKHSVPDEKERFSSIHSNLLELITFVILSS